MKFDRAGPFSAYYSVGRYDRFNSQANCLFHTVKTGKRLMEKCPSAKLYECPSSPPFKSSTASRGLTFCSLSSTAHFMDGSLREDKRTDFHSSSSNFPRKHSAQFDMSQPLLSRQKNFAPLRMESLFRFISAWFVNTVGIACPFLSSTFRGHAQQEPRGKHKHSSFT